MVLADLLRAGLIFSMPFLAQESVGLIYMVAALMGVCTAVFNPGQIKLVGELASREQLVKANSYLGVSRDGTELIGFVVGGVVVFSLGYSLTFMVDAASYVLSALLLVGLPRALPREQEAPRVADLLRESPAVFGRLWRHPGLRTNLLLAVFPLLIVMMNVPNAWGLALQVFDRGTFGFTALEVLTGAGLIVGGLVISRMSLRGDKNRYVFFSLLAMSVLFIGVSFSNWFWLSVGLMALAGVANVGLFVPSITMFQEVPSVADKGRLISLRAGFGQMGATGGLLLGGILGETVGILRLFLLAGVAGIVMTLVIYVPYRAAAARRANAAWAATLHSGATRAAARVAAMEAAAGGPEVAWATAISSARDESAAAATAGGATAGTTAGAPDADGPTPGAADGSGAATTTGAEEAADDGTAEEAGRAGHSMDPSGAPPDTVAYVRSGSVQKCNVTHDSLAPAPVARRSVMFGAAGAYEASGPHEARRGPVHHRAARSDAAGDDTDTERLVAGDLTLGAGAEEE